MRLSSVLTRDNGARSCLRNFCWGPKDISQEKKNSWKLVIHLILIELVYFLYASNDELELLCDCSLYTLEEIASRWPPATVNGS